MSSHLKMVRARPMKFLQFICIYVNYLQAKFECLEINRALKNKLLLKKLRNFFSVNTYFLFFMKFCSDVLQLCTNEPEKNSWCIFALGFFYRSLKFRAACLCSSRPWPLHRPHGTPEGGQDLVGCWSPGLFRPTGTFD